jgi:hypothetical protein
MTLIQHVIGTLPRTMGVAALIDEINAQVPRIEPQRFDVTRYGAAADGVEDDTPAIQYTLDQCFAAGGGTVYLPGGRYRLTRQGVSYYLGAAIDPTLISACGGYALHVPSGVRLLGAGYSTVFLNQGQGPGTSEADPGTWFSAVELVNGTHDVVVEGVRFVGENGVLAAGFVDGTIWHNKQMDCIGVRGVSCHDILVRDCYFENQIGFTVHCEGNADRVHIVDSYHRYCANGLNSNAHRSIQARNTLDHAEGIETDGSYLLLADNIVLFPTETGLSVGGETTPGEMIPSVTAARCQVSDGLKYGILGSDGLSRALFLDCTVTRTAKSGIVVSSDGANPIQGVRVAGCMVVDAGLATSAENERFGIYVKDNLAGEVEDCTVTYGETAGYDTSRALHIGAGATGLRVSRCRLHGSFRDLSNVGTGILVTDDNVLDWSKVDTFNQGAFAAFPRRLGQVTFASPSGGTLTIDPKLGNVFRGDLVNATTFTVQAASAPGQFGTYALDANQTQEVMLLFYNATAGAGPTINFSTTVGVGFRLTGGAFTSPAAGKGKSITFVWDAPAGLYVEKCRAGDF